MKIDLEFNNRILTKDNKEKVNISNGQIIQYTGIYYKPINNPINFIETKTEIESTFIGIVLAERYSFDTGISGIYIEPLYILNKEKNEWNKIINYKSPEQKYFYYPHLLLLPNHYYHFQPLYFLHTCINKSLDEFNNINETFNLDFN